MNGQVKSIILGYLSALVAVSALTPGLAQGGPQAQYKTESKHHQPILWRQYLDAGQKSQQSGNQQLAKRYYMGALAALEQKSQARQDVIKSRVNGKNYRIPFGSVSVQQLENGLSSMYPADWSKAPGTPSQQMALRQEQVSVLYRIAQLNKAHSGPQSSFAERSEKRYEAAAEELKKAQGESSATTVAK